MANKYSNLKIFHYQDKLDSLSKDISEIKAPVHIRIKPTNVCNHNCWYCAYKVDHLQLGQDMVERDFIPESKMMEILQDIKEMGVKAVTFSGGGEPFTYRYFTQTIKKLIEYDVPFASLTNGSKLNGEIAELFAHNATWLRVSIDGYDDESYAKARDVKVGEFSKIIQNMRGFSALGGKCALGVSFIVDSNNYTHTYDFVKLIKETGASSIKISPCVIANESKENDEYHKPLYDEMQKQIQKAQDDFEDDSFEIYNSYHLFGDEMDKTYEWCPFMQILPVIGADLNVYPCQDKAYNLDNGLVGSIKEKSFKDFWFEDKDKFFKINPSCDCKNRCVADGKNRMILDYLNVDTEHLGFV
ncbi:MAG: radical SAM protein [Sulfurimonas sp.]|nr:radical SAM protein [Sulfurimonas sp.]MDD3834169.1 radical SAM protein [Sulfurimonas sp.]